MFKVVGQQRSAVRVVLTEGQSAVANAQLLTINSPKSQLKNSLLSGPADITISTGPNPIVGELKEWTIKPHFVAAKFGKQQILSAAGGIFRIDVPKGDRFILTPSQLVAYQGVRPLNVYEHGRLDVVRAWGSWVREGLRSVFAAVSRATRYIFHKGSQLLSPAVPITTNETPSWYTKDSAYTVYWHRVKTSSRGTWGVVRDWLFYATHAKKLQFDGPCSILIRGKI